MPIGFSLNYLANRAGSDRSGEIGEAIASLAFVFCGGHRRLVRRRTEVLQHADGAIDAIVQGEGEITAPLMLAAIPNVDGLAGVATLNVIGPRATMQADINDSRPARELTRKRHKYFIGELDPCASIEFSRGCPWDCSFCSAWTFYARSYRQADPALLRRRNGDRSRGKPNAFIVDDVAFIYPEHGMAIADEIEKRRVRKRYYLETRCDVLIRNQEVFARWAKMGLCYMFLGLESLDAEQLKSFRKRITPNQNFQALEIARKLKIDVAINLITDPSWGREDFERAHDSGRSEGPGGGAPDGGDAVPRHRTFSHRNPRVDQRRLPSVRHPARGGGDPAATGRILRGVGQDAGDHQPQVHGLADGGGAIQNPRRPTGARADEFSEDAFQIFQGVQRRPLLRRPFPARSSTRCGGPRIYPGKVTPRTCSCI